MNRSLILVTRGVIAVSLLVIMRMLLAQAIARDGEARDLLRWVPDDEDA